MMKNSLLILSLLICSLAFGQNRIRFGNASGTTEASELNITDSGNKYTATNAEGVFAEIADSIATKATIAYVNASDIDTDGINKTADFTLSDMDIQAGVLNIQTNDSIVVTINSGLTETGFVKMIVEGTGFVAVEQGTITTMNGDYKSQSGEGETLGLRVKSGTEAVVLDPSDLLAYAPPPPVVYLYQGNDAADPNNEADLVGANWSSADSDIATFTSITGGAQNGSYFIELERVDTGVFEQGFSFTTEVGRVYQVDVYMKCDAAAGGTQMLARTANGWDAQVFATSNTTDTWELETITVTASGTSGIITFKPNNSSAIGTKTGIDNIVITDVTP